MDSSNELVRFLFDISNEVTKFYEVPVIFLTKKDFSDTVFNTLTVVRKALQEGINIPCNQNTLIDSIVDYHLAWLHAVNDIESFKRRVQTKIDREEVYEAISFTVDAMVNRLKYYKRYMEKNRPYLSNIDQVNITAEIEIVEEMHKEVTINLEEKLKCFRNFTDNEEFRIQCFLAIDELVSWLDKTYDGLSITLCKYVNLNVPQLTGDLTKTLKQIVDELHSSNAAGAQEMIANLKQRGKEISSMLRCTTNRSLEINKVVEKINTLGDRIIRLENDDAGSAAVMALKRKRDFLEKRLASIENLKISLKSVHEKGEINYGDVTEEELCECEDFFQLRIFNHVLPAPERERLVTELCYLWDMAVYGEKSHKSIISILSAAEVKEEFTDEIGTFYVDEYSRKIYRIPGDAILYQQNEINELVPLNDDKDHIYYYDECGRYYVDPKTRQRIYKAHASASEYMMDTSGVLLKIQEERDGVTYYYDNYGRYYINDEGKHIYREEDSGSEYENDGLGNLVRIRSYENVFNFCPLIDDVQVTEDSKYLKDTVGAALRVCIGCTILRQPDDPIRFLSACLVNYRKNLELKDKYAREKEELEAERERIRAEEAAKSLFKEEMTPEQSDSEASYTDSNYVRYVHVDVMHDRGPLTTKVIRTSEISFKDCNI